jgi:two-component system C4-dicarboxylate transport response regulator DctD
MRRVLLVEDDAAVREAVAQTLMLADCAPVAAASFVVAKDHIASDFEGIVVSDIRMPGRDGFHVLEYVQSVDPDLPVILLTGEGDIPMAVRAMGEGAFGFLEKPCAPATLLAEVERALKTRALVLENRALKTQREGGDPAARLIFGVSEKAEALRGQVRHVAKMRGEALITGAPGTGISKIAEVIHLCSAAARAPFEKRVGHGLDASGLDAALAAAKHGALFIDEIQALPPQVQYHLLERLEAGAACRVFGGATEQGTPLQHQMNADLYYHCAVGRVRIPKLAERPEDIAVLFRRYVAQAAEQSGRPAPQIGPDHLAQLMAQDWPGNARALMSEAMRFVLGGAQEQMPGSGLGLTEQMAQVERALLVAALQRAQGQASAAAQDLKLPRKTFYDRLARHGLKPEEFRAAPD